MSASKANSKPVRRPLPLSADVEDARFKRRAEGLVRIAQDVWMTAEGTYERHDAEQLLDIQILQEALENWLPSETGRARRDEAVRHLVALALEASGKKPERMTVYAMRQGATGDLDVGSAMLGHCRMGRQVLVIELDAQPVDGRFYIPVKDILALYVEVPAAGPSSEEDAAWIDGRPGVGHA